jgi:LuxR family transcriptional regulator, maltose regulon positive regulatory protein
VIFTVRLGADGSVYQGSTIDLRDSGITLGTGDVMQYGAVMSHSGGRTYLAITNRESGSLPHRPRNPLLLVDITDLETAGTVTARAGTSSLIPDLDRVRLDAVEAHGDLWFAAETGGNSDARRSDDLNRVWVIRATTAGAIEHAVYAGERYNPEGDVPECGSRPPYLAAGLWVGEFDGATHAILGGLRHLHVFRFPANSVTGGERVRRGTGVDASDLRLDDHAIGFTLMRTNPDETRLFVFGDCKSRYLAVREADWAGAAGDRTQSRRRRRALPLHEVPPAGGGRGRRRARVARLAQALHDHRVVLVRAPAGSGKTTLLAAWAAEAREPVAWLRVDAGDVDADILAAALHAAVLRVVPSLGRRVPGLLAGRGAARDPRALATALVNDLADTGDLVLALDDLHAIGPGAASLLALLVDLLPPHVRVLAASRSAPPLPVARLRVRGELGELGSPTSGSTSTTSGASWRAGTRPTTPPRSASWQRAAAGPRRSAWRPARCRSPPKPEIGDEPSDRIRSELWDYLAEEVLREQPTDLRTFLLETSVLEELRADVCAAVTGRADAADVLAELEARDLFVARFRRPDGEAWRYHDLFADFLRDRLRRERGPAEVADLHRRAAAALPTLAALPHLFAAAEPETAAARIVESMLTSFDSSILPHLMPWLERLPPEVVSADPRLAMLRGWHADILGRSGEARALVEPTWRRLVADGRDDEAIDLGLQLVGSLLALGDMEACDEVFRRPASTGGDLDLPRRVIVLVSRLWREWNRRDPAAMSALLEEALELALQGGEGAAANVLAMGLTSPLCSSIRAPPGSSSVPSASTPSSRPLTRRCGSSSARSAPPPRCSPSTWLAPRPSCARSSRLRGRRSPRLDPSGRRGAAAHAAARAGRARHGPDHGGRRRRSKVGIAHVRALVAGVRVPGAPGGVARARRTRPSWADARYLPGDLLDCAPSDAIVRGVAEAWLAVAKGSAPDGREPLAALAAAEEVQGATRAWLGHGLPGLERGSLLLEAGRATAAVDAAEATLEAAARYGAGILLPDVEAHRPLLARCAASGSTPT